MYLLTQSLHTHSLKLIMKTRLGFAHRDKL